MTAAERLAAAGRDVIVLERESLPGGLCRSFRYGAFTFDIGPHRLFSADPAIAAYFRAVLGPHAAGISRHSQVHLWGRYMNWPLSMRSVFRMPPVRTLQCLFDLLRIDRRGNGETRSLEAYVRARYGETIYRTFWEGYTSKFLGIPCSEVDAVWGRVSVGRSVVDRRAEPNGLHDLVANCLRARGRHLDFLYPRGGMGVFPARQAELVRERGGRVFLSQTVDGLRVEGRRIVEVNAGATAYPADCVIWSAPLTELTALLGRPFPDLSYLCTVLFNVEIEGELPGMWQWIYYPDAKCVFSRVSRPVKFGPETAPPGMTGLCVEVPGNRASVVWRHPERFVERVSHDLVKTGLVRSAGAVQAVHIENVPDSYPIYRLGFRRHVQRAHAFLAGFENLHLAGREAMFQHDNIDEAVVQAGALAERLAGRGAAVEFAA